MGESHSGQRSSISTTRRSFLAAVGSAAWMAAYGLPGFDWLAGAAAAAEQAKPCLPLPAALKRGDPSPQSSPSERR